jgi:peptidyl-prolyl cis-trans isomerase C
MDARRILLREPLVHFLAAGALLFCLFAWYGRETGSPRHIVVDRAALLQYLQSRGSAEPGTLDQQLDGLSAEQRGRLIDDYLREEVLYREARALGLEQGDSVMRQRLVQKMKFLLEDSSDAQPSDSTLQQYLQTNRKLYAVEAAWTFTHVFLDPAERGEPAAAQRARALLRELNAAGAKFNDSPRYSDRFPYLQNYVERTPAYIAGQFGEPFMASLHRMQAAPGAWQGPLRSELGWHLVMITAFSPERMPQLQEIRPQLLDDYRRERAAVAREEATEELMKSYKVDLRDLAERP